MTITITIDASLPDDPGPEVAKLLHFVALKVSAADDWLGELESLGPERLQELTALTVKVEISRN